MIDLVGYLCSICLLLCAVPEVIRTYKRGYCSVSYLFLLLWLIGELLGTVYTAAKGEWPLFFNYLFNFIMILYLIDKQEDL